MAKYGFTIVHAIAAIGLGVFVYGPEDVRSGGYETVTLFVFFPLLALTGAVTLSRRLRHRGRPRADRGRSGRRPGPGRSGSRDDRKQHV